jgi:hypothetical protein
MPKDTKRTGIPFRVELNLDGTPTETSGKTLEELALEQNPDIPEEEIRAAVSNTVLHVYKMVYRDDYQRLKDQNHDEMSDEDKEKWPLISLLFSDEMRAASEARFAKLMAESEAHKQKQQLARRQVTKEMAIAEALAEPVFTLDLPDEYLVKLTEAGFTSVGQVVFSIKVSRETILDAYLGEEDKATSNKLIDYMKITKQSLSEILGGTGYALIGSRLLQYDYVTRSEFLELFRGRV